LEWHDEAQHAKEAKDFSQVLGKYGGKFLVSSKDVKIMEGQWKPRTLVILKFLTMGAFQTWYRSKEYAPLLAIRLKFADTNGVVVEGND